MKLLKLIIPMLGILLLGYLIGSLGSDEIIRHLSVLKWTFPQVLLLAFSWHITTCRDTCVEGTHCCVLQTEKGVPACQTQYQI